MRKMWNSIYKSGHFWEAVLVSLAWLLVSVVSAYQSLALHCDTSLFKATTAVDYREKLLIPIGVFLCGFTLDFWVSIKNAYLDERKSDVIKIFVFQIFLLIITLTALFISEKIYCQMFSFTLVWLVITSIKGLAIVVTNDFEIPNVEPFNNTLIQ